MKKIRKAVFPVAGMGTRFLPATKVIPKEMLPIVDRPLIQYAVDEAREAGIEQMIFVTGRGKNAIEDHFDIAFELERTMADRGKDVTILDGSRLRPGNASFVRQQEPLGLGHAIWCARDIVGDEPFAIFLPDEFMLGTPGNGCMKQMVDAYAQTGGNLISVLEVPHDQVSSYGVIAPGARRLLCTTCASRAGGAASSRFAAGAGAFAARLLAERAIARVSGSSVAEGCGPVGYGPEGCGSSTSPL